MLPVGKCGRNKHLRLSQDPGGKTIGRRYRRYLRISRRDELASDFRFHQRLGQRPNTWCSTPRIELLLDVLANLVSFRLRLIEPQLAGSNYSRGFEWTGLI